MDDEVDTGTVMVEYSQPNTRKAFHVSHLRNSRFWGATSVEFWNLLATKLFAPIT